MTDSKLTSRVVARHIAASIRWIKSPGRIAELAASPGGGVYAQSADKRFMVSVHRFMTGDAGRRQYLYYFTAVDYGIPSGGQRFTDVPVRDTEKSDPKKTLAAVERWAESHPL